MNNIIKYNTLKRLDLISKILKLKNDGKFRLICIDVDDVIFNTEPLTQKMLEDIDYRSTIKYRERISHKSSEDFRELSDASFNILDAILEETAYEEYDEEKEKTIIKNYKQIDYSKIYKEENLMPNAVDFVNRILEERRENDFVIFLSHINPEREGLIKTEILYKLFPKIDAIEMLPFHVERGSKINNSKAVWLKQLYSLESLENCYLIDNSEKNCKDFRKHDGNYVVFLQEEFDENSTLADHMSRLVDLDPYMLQFAISFVDYCRSNTDYLEKVNTKVKKL